MDKTSTTKTIAPTIGRTPLAAFLSLNQAAELIGCTRRFLEKRAEDGEIKLFRPSRKLVRVSREELNRWIETFSRKGGPQGTAISEQLFSGAKNPRTR